MKNKLLLLETEMVGPGGHYLDNVIESYYYFKKNLHIQCLLNKKFQSQGTFIPNELHLIKKLNLIHVISNILSPIDTDWETYEILGPSFNLKREIKDRFLTKVESLFSREIILKMEVVEGNPYREMLLAAKNLDSNLVIVPRKE